MNEIVGSTLYVVATPIGNLQDLTLRGLKVLGEVNHLYAEDTRVTQGMLQRHGIKRSVSSYREAADRGLLERIITDILFKLKQGESVAYVSDAGSPGVSDPGNYLVSRVVALGYSVVPIPGASALPAILSVAGFPSMRPLFVGFLPKKKGHQTLMGKLKGALESGVCDTVVFYESPERIVKLLGELMTWEMPLQVCLGRELTKLYEEIMRGTPEEVMSDLSKRATIKGEITLAIYYEQP
ncbi:MAG: ribosomal RNA small subunit methyltransferase I [bacterium]